MIADFDATAPAPVGDLGDPALVGEARSYWSRALGRFLQHRVAVASLIVLVLLFAAGLLASRIAPYGYQEANLQALNARPSWSHPFGADQLGRDYFSRTLYGIGTSARTALLVGFLASLIGTIVGALAGYYGGWIDNLLMRVTDLFLALPFLVILIVGSRVPFIADRGALGIVVILSLFFWMPLARIVRGVFLSMKEKEFVEAARSVGASNPRIIFGQMLPNALGPIIVNATLGIAGAILAESALSFLGFGVQPPLPTWGNLLLEAQPFALTSPYLTLFPGLFILATVLCVNFLGDGLRDALDPHQRIRARE